MGPQHPSTHGVLRLLLELDGEIVLNCIPDIGFLHTGIEKNMESKTYQQAEVMTDRIDYMNNVGNNFVYCMAVENWWIWMCRRGRKPYALFSRN